jgi:Zn-dependent peptidase ImmA (M78 family)
MLSADEALEQRIIDEGIFVTESTRIPNSADGLFCKGNNKKVICLRSRMSSCRRLCTLAEEYGHAVTSWGDARSMDPAEMTRQEARAIAYAIELVVPLEKLYKAHDAGVRNAFECAEYLGVTEEFLAWVFAYYEARVPGFRMLFANIE